MSREQQQLALSGSTEEDNLCLATVGSEGTQCGKFVGLAALMTIFGLCNWQEQAGHGTYPVLGGIEMARAGWLHDIPSSRGHQDDDPLCCLLRGVEKMRPHES
jgi:hypothetical protein